MVENDYYKDIISALQKIEDGEDRSTIRKVTKVWRHEYQKRIGIGKRIFIAGNGGSCAIAEHISTDLNKRCKVKAHTLSNNSLLTALTNDYGQENALDYAHDCLGSTFSIFGMDGEDPFPEKSFEHDYIHIDNYNYGVIELSSEIILHGIVESLVVE